MVRAKFAVQSVTKTYYMRFSKATPSGEITMFVDNPPASAFLIEGGVFYVDFTAVPKAEPVTA